MTAVVEGERCTRKTFKFKVSEFYDFFCRKIHLEENLASPFFVPKCIGKLFTIEARTKLCLSYFYGKHFQITFPSNFEILARKFKVKLVRIHSQYSKITQNVAFEFFNFWRFPPIFVLLKMTCLVTLFDRKLQVFQKLAKMDYFLAFLMNFCLLFRKRSSLRSLCWMGLSEGFSNTVCNV